MTDQHYTREQYIAHLLQLLRAVNEAEAIAKAARKQKHPREAIARLAAAMAKVDELEARERLQS